MVFCVFICLLFIVIPSEAKESKKGGALQVSVPPMVMVYYTAVRLTAWNCKGATRSY
jgi:hypothetical protein